MPPIVDIAPYLDPNVEPDYVTESLWNGYRRTLGPSNHEFVVSPAIFFAPIHRFLGDHVWLGGGALVRWLEGARENEGDFDLFSDDPVKVRDMLVAEDTTIPLRTSPLSETYALNGKGYTVQVISRPYPSLLKVLDSFDFHARMVGTDGNVLLVHSQAFADIQNRRLTRHDGDFSITVTSLYGVAKYANRGYTLTHPEAAKFLRAWGAPISSIHY